MATPEEISAIVRRVQQALDVFVQITETADDEHLARAARLRDEISAHLAELLKDTGGS